MSVFQASVAGNMGQPANAGPLATPASAPGTGGGTPTTPASGGRGGDGARKGAPRVHAQSASGRRKRRIMTMKTIGSAAFNPPVRRGSGSQPACRSGGQASGGVLLPEDPRAEDTELVADDHRQRHEHEVERIA